MDDAIFDLGSEVQIEQFKRALRAYDAKELPAAELDSPYWTRATQSGWDAFIIHYAALGTTGGLPTAAGLAELARESEKGVTADYALKYWPDLRHFADIQSRTNAGTVLPPLRGPLPKRGVGAVVGGAAGSGLGAALGAVAAMVMGKTLAVGAAIGAGAGLVLGTVTGSAVASRKPK